MQGPRHFLKSESCDDEKQAEMSWVSRPERKKEKSAWRIVFFQSLVHHVVDRSEQSQRSIEMMTLS
jgi:hypothetical protein